MNTNNNHIYTGSRHSGLAMLTVVLLLLAAAIAAMIGGGIILDSDHPSAVAIGATLLCSGFAAVIIGIILACGFTLIEPNEARALLFFGNYRGNLLDTGFWWINPFMTVKNISLRARNLNVDPIKVNDRTGNPIMIGLVLVWRVKRDDIYRAVFDVDASSAASGEQTAVSGVSMRMQVLENFVRVQSDAALRQVAGCYAYDSADTSNDELSLRSDSSVINEQLEAKLSERLELAGIEIVEARINYLAYAPEIAAVMLRRQQADAIISAREKIVEGAVSMVKMALDRLSNEDIVTLDQDKKAAMVGNLLVVLCADEAARPVLNTGAENH